MGLLIFYLLLALGVSFLCSLMEAVLLSVTPAYTTLLEQQGMRVGRSLRRFKEDIDRPLAAILSLNTIAHTVGAAGVGAQAAHLFGDAWLGLVSGILTLLLLIVSEIIPKTLGALYWRRLTPLVVAFFRRRDRAGLQRVQHSVAEGPLDVLGPSEVLLQRPCQSMDLLQVPLDQGRLCLLLGR